MTVAAMMMTRFALFAVRNFHAAEAEKNGLPVFHAKIGRIYSAHQMTPILMFAIIVILTTINCVTAMTSSCRT